MEKKKRIIAICIAVALVIITIALIAKLISIKNNKEKEVANTNENSIQSNIVENNTIENNIIENDEENKTTENTVMEEEKDPSENNTSVGEEEITKTEIEKEKSNKEKVMEIVKKDWGDDDNVYFSSDDSASTNKEYVIYVRESKTTWEICKYTVNVENGTFVKEQ